MIRRSRWIPVVLLLAWTARAARADALFGNLVPLSEPPCASAEDIAPRLEICDAGGEGARSCETRWVVNVSGWGWQSGCGISCGNGYYACCINPSASRNAVCGCIQDPPHVAPIPYSPERPGL